MVISILCGGSGTRLWPISRVLMPKQFAKLIGEDSLFKLTLRRNKIFNSPFQIITNDKSYFLALDEASAENIDLDSCILESVSKNTALALCIGAMDVAIKNKDEIILALPSDHIIHNLDQYQKSVEEAKKLAVAGNIVVFGITPTSPHTGYGYIHSKNLHEVLGFKEKPNFENAKKYFDSKEYFWNSGMFCYKACTLLEEMQKYCPDIFEAAQKVFDKSNESRDTKFLRLDKLLSEAVREESIDYAVMEKSNVLKIVRTDFNWNDVGSFDSLDEEYHKDENSNSGSSNITCIDSKNNLIISDKMVSAIGLNDFVVIDTFDALLIVKKGRTQDVKKIVASLNKSKNKELTQIHNQAFRPWGSYTVLLDRDKYKLKSILVRPKERLSLQKHFHRNEHWIVVSGSAIVQIGDKEILLKPNESTYISAGEVHRLTNPGLIDLVLIEVQVGEYLGEDDIVRLQDDYKRE